MNGVEMRLFDMDGDEEAVRPPRPATNRARHYAVADVAGAAGWVGVDRDRALVEVELDEKVVRGMRPEHLGGYLVEALRQAEERALEKRRDAIHGGMRGLI
jgi:DNA-binding protein YbaB